MHDIGPVVPPQVESEDEKVERDALYFIEPTDRRTVVKVTTVIELPDRCERSMPGVFRIAQCRQAPGRRELNHQYLFTLNQPYEALKDSLKRELHKCVSAELRAQRKGALIVLARGSGVEVVRFNALFDLVRRSLAHYDYKKEEGRERWILLKRLRFRYERFEDRVKKGQITVTNVLETLGCAYTTTTDPENNIFTVTITSIPAGAKLTK